MIKGRMSRRRGEIEETDKLTRIAIVNADKCKPKRCRQECKKSCPVVRMGKLCIEVTPLTKIASISEELCIGCGICVKVSQKVLTPILFTNTNHCRNVLLRQSPSSIYLVICNGKPLTVTAKTRSNCTDFRSPVLVKYWAW